MDMEELWSKTREVLRAEVNAVVYNSLLGSNNLVPALLDGDTLVLRVVMDNLKLLITNQWYSTIVRALSQVAGHQMDVEILTQEEIEALMDRCHALGTKVVGVTLGSRGSIFSEEGKRYHQGIVPVEAIDTMGAGDSFIAGFLTRRILGDGMEDALRFAATAAANTCKFHGGFGYPHPLD